MDNFQTVIANSELDRNKVQFETINEFKNVNKKHLYRFKLKHDPNTSFIFKPTNSAVEVSQELWVQEHFRSHIPDVYTPRILEHYINESTNEYWMVLEDAGALTHTYSEDVLIDAARAMVKWHKLPATTTVKQSKAFLPYIDQALMELLDNGALYRDLLSNLNIDKSRIFHFFDQLDSLNGSFPTEKVVSHGDYLIINIANKDDRLVVLDWEFLQINSTYFDLFTLMDMAVIRYRIQPTKEIRMNVLKAYMTEREKTGWIAPVDFIRNYHLYVLIYSVLTLKWLFSDLETGKFDRTLLLLEKEELTRIINDCLDYVEGSV